MYIIIIFNAHLIRKRLGDLVQAYSTTSATVEQSKVKVLEVCFILIPY